MKQQDTCLYWKSIKLMCVRCKYGKGARACKSGHPVLERPSGLANPSQEHTNKAKSSIAQPLRLSDDQRPRLFRAHCGITPEPACALRSRCRALPLVVPVVAAGRLEVTVLDLAV